VDRTGRRSGRRSRGLRPTCGADPMQRCRATLEPDLPNVSSPRPSSLRRGRWHTGPFDRL